LPAHPGVLLDFLIPEDPRFSFFVRPFFPPQDPRGLKVPLPFQSPCAFDPLGVLGGIFFRGPQPPVCFFCVQANKKNFFCYPPRGFPFFFPHYLRLSCPAFLLETIPFNCRSGPGNVFVHLFPSNVHRQGNLFHAGPPNFGQNRFICFAWS